MFASIQIEKLFSKPFQTNPSLFYIKLDERKLLSSIAIYWYLCSYCKSIKENYNQHIKHSFQNYSIENLTLNS
jgi:hypothetical protein